MTNLIFKDVCRAGERIKGYVNHTDLLENKEINDKLGAQIFFKMENTQKIHAFKARGAFNAILSYREKHGKFPEKIVAHSSGNHAQAVAFACKEFGIKALIYMINKASPLKIVATKELGAEVVLCEKRSEVNSFAEEKQKEGYFFIHPADGDDVISGQGTAALESLKEIGEVDAIFAPCGGGGLVCGSYLAAQGLSKNAQVFACEPANANDVARSVREGKIIGYEDSPNTVADGARTLSTMPQTFIYLQKLAGVLEISEEKIISWQQNLTQTLGQRIEPTSALAIAGAEQFLEQNPNLKKPKILVILSGGNVAD